jgi:aldose 1-epimerase
MFRFILLFVAIVQMAAFSSCENRSYSVRLLSQESFDTTLNGKKVGLYTLKNANGLVVQVTNYGARVVSLWVPCKGDSLVDVVWGYPSIKSYLAATDCYSGPIVGRFGNRIGKGCFAINGKGYKLSLNDHGNHLHGGSNGFWSRVWDVESDSSSSVNPSITLSYLSPDGEEGYPGDLKITVKYILTETNRLKVEYAATTSKPTIVNPTSHIYFNLHGNTARSICSHVLQIRASSFTPTDSLLIPTGEIASAIGTPLDFNQPTPIGKRIGEPYQPLIYGKGYDHNWVLAKPLGKVDVVAAVFEPSTGVEMLVATDQPGLQFYSGNFMNGKDVGKYGQKHLYRSGIALETQNFPDAPNHPNFPSAFLEPGQVYKQSTYYEFRLRK